MKRFIWIVTGITVSASLIAAMLSFRSAQRSGIAASELANHNKHLSVEIDDARQRLAARTHDVETLLQQVQSLKEPLVSAGPAKPQLQPPRRELADLMEANPALRTLFRQSFRANLGMQFLPWYNRAHLSSEQTEKFEALLTDAEQDRLDLEAAAKTQGLAVDDPSLESVRKQANEKSQSAFKEILGDAGLQSLYQYTRLQPLQGFTMGFARQLARAGNPLSTPQVDQLLDALGNSSNRYQTGGRVGLATIDSKRALQQAELILTPSQFEAFQANANEIELMKLQKQFYQQKKTDAK